MATPITESENIPIAIYNKPKNPVDKVTTSTINQFIGIKWQSPAQVTNPQTGRDTSREYSYCFVFWLFFQETKEYGYEITIFTMGTIS